MPHLDEPGIMMVEALWRSSTLGGLRANIILKTEELNDILDKSY
jgi:hypothetical protein